MENDGRNGFRYGCCTSVYRRDTYCYTRLLLQFVKRGRGGKKRKQGSDTLGNVAIAFVFIVIGKITFIELDAYPRTMKWKKGGKIGHDTSFETTPQFSFARNFIVYICIYKLKRITTSMINSCYFPEDEDHVPLIERWFKFLKILGK